MKLIDWSRVPRGTMTNIGEFLQWRENEKYAHVLIKFGDRFCVELYDEDELRIAPQTRWTYHDGEDCPVPEGVTFDVQYLEGHAMSAENGYRWDKIIAYRITGVDRAGGWTDDPAEVTQPVEITSQQSYSIGGVGVTFTVGRIPK